MGRAGRTRGGRTGGHASYCPPIGCLPDTDTGTGTVGRRVLYLGVTSFSTSWKVEASTSPVSSRTSMWSRTVWFA